MFTVRHLHGYMDGDKEVMTDGENPWQEALRLFWSVYADNMFALTKDAGESGVDRNDKIEGLLTL